MNVYFLSGDSNHYQGVIVRFGLTDEFVHSFNGTPMEKPLAPATIRWDPDMFRLPKGDFPSLFMHIPVFSEEAVTVLADLLVGNGELIPVPIGREKYYLFNVTRVIDALDEPGSEIVRFKDSSEMLDISIHHFLPDRLEDAVVFKIPQSAISDVFVTDPFVERVRSAGLKGFDFELAWSDEPGYVPKPRSLF